MTIDPELSHIKRRSWALELSYQPQRIVFGYGKSFFQRLIWSLKIFFAINEHGQGNFQNLHAHPKPKHFKLSFG